ncbi:uncharacterized protein [Drosophila kikkawai]|uniref:Uncharacterized protein isoform X1 n=1 Tax=Drosophila kikkawai TaxID=30033 RepID=A0ABM3C7J7_DROKI|nr:uncharacterized protein LOC108081470 isoform X1 [Drosophila kikkawai]XP_041632711.1 uncharacterized protein LOC108081470 isoform X1 [Drosophila kikkawai]XP_041632712.1 uncharacterized protein LOC108081470 isoform X1 [Drosophila kikkawai]
MFSQLIGSQLQDMHATSVEQSYLSDQQKKTNSLPHIRHKTEVDAKQHRRSTSNLSDAGGKFFSQLSSKYSSQLIDKFIRSELLNSSYDSLKFQKGNSTPLYSNLQVPALGGFDCLQGSYRTHGDGEIYEVVQVKQPERKSSYEGQAFSKAIHHRNLKELRPLTTLNTHTSDDYPEQKASIDKNTTNKSQSLCMQSSGSGCESKFQRSTSGSSSSGTASRGWTSLTAMPAPERFQRRRLLQVISAYDLQNKQLQRELAKEKRRRTEELACVVKSLILFEAKLKNDLKSVNQRMLDRDAEICRLTRLTRTLRRRLKDQQRDKSMIGELGLDRDKCLVLKELQCKNCRKQFYDIDISTKREEFSVGAKAEPDSSSDDTLSSSFCGVRRSVRYTSKRTAGTFQDYMRSRAMHIENPALEQHSEENTSSVSLEDSQTSYEQLRDYVRDMDIKLPLDVGEYVNQSGEEQEKGKTQCSPLVTVHLEEEDDIFSPAQKGDDTDDDQKQNMMSQGCIKIVQRRFADFSEASPKQIYETTTDDWYASASDQEESSTLAAKPYGRGAVNPVLECVNQILIQQSMEETMVDLAPKSSLASRYISNSNLARRSSLGGRNISNARKRVHFSTKNSMVHVPLNNDQEAQVRRQIQISSYRSMTADVTTEALSYGSIYSNEYEPIGSERASNLYVDMAATFIANNREEIASSGVLKTSMKSPPALPPKPANLLKFQKSPHQFEKGQQKDENDCGASITTSEPDYCSISEVGITRNCVQIVVDVHKAQESNSPPTVEPKMYLEEQAMQTKIKSIDNHSDDNHSEKTDEIEEIFADIPKLPNVAAIIAPKQSDSDALMIEPKASLRLQRPAQIPQHSQSLSLSTIQYKRKHVPNILAEINKRITLPNSQSTSKSLPNTPESKSVPTAVTIPSSEMSIQAEFDWYNLDAEYDRSHQEGKNPNMPATADEYNLDEEFQQEEYSQQDQKMEDIANALDKSHLEPVKAKQMVLNLANFEKFIEGSGLSTKPLPYKRKTYLNAPIV